jgi:GntR family transcriptional regulator
MADFDPSKPIYQQIAEDILRKAVRGEFLLGQRIPSARDYASQKLVNPNTVVRAFQDLERDGLVVVKRGLGNFLTEDKQRLEAARLRLAERSILQCTRDLRELGYSTLEIQRLLKAQLEVV